MVRRCITWPQEGQNKTGLGAGYLKAAKPLPTGRQCATLVIGNVVTAVFLSPIALQAALELGIAPHLSMMMVASGVLTGFITPIGTP